MVWGKGKSSRKIPHKNNRTDLIDHDCGVIISLVEQTDKVVVPKIVSMAEELLQEKH